MIGWAEAIAIIIVGGTLLDVVLSLYGNARRRARVAKQHDAALRMFREQAELVLRARRAERDIGAPLTNGNDSQIHSRLYSEDIARQ